MLVSAAAAALHYLPALSQEQRATPDLHAGVESLLTLMEAHVRASNARGYTYARDAGPRTSWCWELCRVAQSERGLVHEGLVVALEEAALRGHIAPSEEGALRRLRYIVGPPSDSPEKVCFMLRCCHFFLVPDLKCIVAVGSGGSWRRDGETPPFVGAVHVWPLAHRINAVCQPHRGRRG